MDGGGRSLALSHNRGGYITNRLDFMKTDPVKFLKTIRLGFKKFKILFVKNNKIRKSEW
jgi:hypothetical protein